MTDTKIEIELPKMSEWECLVFGTTTIVWCPLVGEEPNWWNRFWMKVFFNSKWKKLTKKE